MVSYYNHLKFERLSHTFFYVVMLNMDFIPNRGNETVYIKPLENGMFAYTIIDRVGMVTAQNVGNYDDIMRLVGYNADNIQLMLNK